MRPEECQEAAVVIATGAMKAAEMNTGEVANVQEIKEQEVLREVLKEEAAELEVIEVGTEVTDVKKEITPVKKEVIEVQTDVTEVQTEVQEDTTAEKTEESTEALVAEHTEEVIAMKTKPTEVFQERMTRGQH